MGAIRFIGIKRGKLSKTYEKYVFSSESLVFESNSLKSCTCESLKLLFLKEIENYLLWLLFWKERWQRFAHGRSFLKCDEVDSLTVALFWRATRANRSQLLFFKERKCEDRKSEFPTLAMVFKFAFHSKVHRFFHSKQQLMNGWTHELKLTGS